LANEDVGVDIDDDVTVDAEVDANAEADEDIDPDADGVDERCCKPGTVGIWGPSGSKCTGKPLKMALITFSTSTKRSKSKSMTATDLFVAV
jgi:hypothetical protein